MPLAIVCAGCKRRLRVADTLVGKAIKCPQCARKMVVKKPAAAPAERPAAQAKKTMVNGPASQGPPTKALPPTAKPKAGKNGTASATAPPKPKAAARKPAPPKETEPAPSPSGPEAAPVKKPEPWRPPGKSDSGGLDLKWLLLGLLGIGLVVAGVLYVVYGLVPGSGEVSGTVTLGGLPLSGATVVFVGEKEGEPELFRTITQNDGQYTFRGRTLPAGRYKVTVSKVGLNDGTVPGTGEAEQTRDPIRLDLPEMYGKAGTTTLVAEIQRGRNTLDFPLLPTPPP